MKYYVVHKDEKYYLDAISGHNIISRHHLSNSGFEMRIQGELIWFHPESVFAEPSREHHGVIVVTYAIHAILLSLVTWSLLPVLYFIMIAIITHFVVDKIEKHECQKFNES